MPADVLIVGSINADLCLAVDRHPTPGETLAGSGGTIAPGGKGANQALAAARMGARTAMVGAVGDDAAARSALALLRESTVDLDGVSTVEGPTGLAVITVSPGGENSIIVVSGANGTIDSSRVERVPTHEQQIVVSQGEISTSAVDALARVTPGRFVLNLAPVIPVAYETLLVADPLIVNEHEGRLALGLLEAVDIPEHDHDIVEALRQRGVRSVVMTRGALGAIVAERNEQVTVDSPSVSAVDTTGAGDAFVGALAARLADGRGLVEAARAAVRVGAFACTRAGAQESYPYAGDAFLEIQ